MRQVSKELLVELLTLAPFSIFRIVGEGTVLNLLVHIHVGASVQAGFWIDKFAE